MRPSEQEYLAFIELLMKIFAALAEEYMDSSVQVFITLAAWKCDSWNPQLEGNWLQVRHSSAGWHTENVIVQVSWDPGIKGILLSLRYSSAFWRPENAIPETLGSNLCSYRFSYNIHFGVLKMQFMLTWLLLKAFKTFWRPEIRFLKDHETHRLLSST